MLSLASIDLLKLNLSPSHEQPPLSFVLLLLALVGHTVLWVGIVNRIHGFAIARWFVDAVTFVCLSLLIGVPLFLIGRAFFGDSLPVPFVGDAANSAWGWYAGGCVLLAIVAGLGRLYANFLGESTGVVLSHSGRIIDLREEFGYDLVAAGVPRTLSNLPGNELLQLELAEKELLIPKLPEELDGLRIAHISDLHMSGRVGRAYFERVVALAGESRPDLVVLTGDLVEYPSLLDWVDDTIAKLAAPGGVYFVLGNHDLKTDHQRLRQMLTSAGQIDLGGNCVELDWRGQRIRLVGNELPWFTPAGDPTGDGQAVDLTLALAHSPDQFGWAARAGVDLLLAGHNHGGQIRFPLIGALVAPSVHGTRYACGSFRRGDCVMHVTRGAGSLAPLRFNCPPELAILTLRRSQPEE